MTLKKEFNKTDIIITNVTKKNILEIGLNKQLPIKIIIISYN
jgi:hypothetical protein